MIKQQFIKNKLLLAGIVALVIAIGIISVYGYTQYGPKQITISTLDTSTGKMDTKTVTASNADTVEKVLRNNHIPIDSIHYICSENLNSKVRDISQIHIEKKTTAQSKTTNENNDNQGSNTQNVSSTQNTSSVTSASSSGSKTDGKSKTPSSTAVLPVSVPIVNNGSKTQEVTSVTEKPQDTVTTLSDSVPSEDLNTSHLDEAKKDKSDDTTESETVVAMSESTQVQSDQLVADNAKASLSNSENDNLSMSSDNNDDSITTSSSKNDNEVKSADTDKKTNVEQSVKTEIIEMDIPYGTRRVNSDQVKQGEEIVTTLGANGLKNVTYEVTYVEDKVISRKTISEEIITEPITEVISVGTGTETTLQPATTNPSPDQEKSDETSNESQAQPGEDIRDYLSEYALSVNMSNGGTYGNAIQSTSTINMDFVRAVVAQEGGTSYEGALGVISCIMNRADSGAWGETDVESIIKTPGQFEAYESGAYEKYLGQSLPEVEAAIRDCMDCGLRTHPYESFRGYQTDGSVTNIGGNWYF